VILARGLGTRMRPHSGAALTTEQAAVASRGTKALIPMTTGRPFIHYSLAALEDAGVTRVCFVIGPEHDDIRTTVAECARPGMQVDFAIQQAPVGTADAVLSARDFVGDENFLVMNADNYYPAGVLRALRSAPAPALPGFTRAGLLRDGLIPPDRIATYALLDVGADESLVRIVEKPDAHTFQAMHDAPVSMNCWSFTPAIFDACRNVPVSRRGEYELPLAVQYAVQEMAMHFSVFPVDATVLDLSHQADIPGVSRALEAMGLDT
jgi:glucose-1-phosphate thymidylyltransferase